MKRRLNGKKLLNERIIRGNICHINYMNKNKRFFLCKQILSMKILNQKKKK